MHKCHSCGKEIEDGYRVASWFLFCDECFADMQDAIAFGYFTGSTDDYCVEIDFEKEVQEHINVWA